MIKYLQETQDDDLTLEMNNMIMSDCQSDADFAAHADMKSHTDVVLNKGK